MKGADVMLNWFVDLGISIENMLSGATPDVCQSNRVRLVHSHGQEKHETQTFIRHLFFFNARYVSSLTIL